eukprot:TRINITY_DN6397_c0_g1_i4.p1 TRINITY_DN6397_c0_g1~~TRINITY_DN6397_c0_g1_i4.p1  ORF type:complete len:231 (+),score=3.66 TRINITY_DN6397_c0_g1_i4:36-728(+)
MAFSVTGRRCCPLKLLEINNTLLSYCLQNSTPLPKAVVDVLSRTRSRQQFGDKLLSSVQVLQMNRLLIKLTGAKKILDIGTYTGVSAVNSALATSKTGKVYSFEKSHKHIKTAQENIQMSGVEDRVSIIKGEAKNSLERLCKTDEGSFGFSYIDADKANYPAYFDLSLRLLKPGGFIAIDNTLYRGLVTNSTDKTGQRINAANNYFSQSREVELIMLNIGDGYTIAIKEQ